PIHRKIIFRYGKNRNLIFCFCRLKTLKNLCSMRKSLRSLTLLSGSLLLGALAFGQQADRFAYSVTDMQHLGSNWNYLRKLDLKTGEYSPILLSGNDQNFLAYSAVTKKQFTQPLNDAKY